MYTLYYLSSQQQRCWWDCTGWSAPLLIGNGVRHVFVWPGSFCIVGTAFSLGRKSFLNLSDSLIFYGGEVTLNFLNIRTPKNFVVITLKFEQCGCSLIWVCTVCPGLSVRKLRIITVKDSKIQNKKNTSTWMQAHMQTFKTSSPKGNNRSPESNVPTSFHFKQASK